MLIVKLVQYTGSRHKSRDNGIFNVLSCDTCQKPFCAWKAKKTNLLNGYIYIVQNYTVQKV